MRLHALFSIAVIMLFASSCSHRKSAKRAPSVPPPPARTVHIGDVERGIASWYGVPYHGRRAANGEIYDMRQLTAAHRTMPFGTWLRVENESNRKQVNVRITDRGPFVGDRIIDLSQRAAEEIAMIGPGLAKVKLTVIAPPKGEVVELYGVQVAAWSDRERAEALRRELSGKFPHVVVVPNDAAPVLYRVITGRSTRDDAQELMARLRAAGYRGFVLRLDLPKMGVSGPS
ncbi:septal ring lytic transglycosylase RlpA family protein [Bryobacter aggregatus]|uniref:septal ring lytic transglycosylase RlpA family protein n=1 Tax=Bryobacter aggregatus TaxID=360054 RepID=UPI0004E1C37C|nr:SPOR domain-containing protein [Bryobacter aggregatus]